MYSNIPDIGDTDLEEELAQLTAAFRHMPAGMAMLDRELRYIRVNEALAGMNGLAPDAHAGLLVFDVVPDISGQMEAAFRHVLETGKPLVGVEVSGFSPGQGEERHYSENVTPLRDRDGCINWLLVSVMDVTDRVKAERSLRAALGEMSAFAAEREAILGQLAEGVVVADRDGRIAFMNEAAIRIHGTDAMGVGPDHYADRYGLMAEDGSRVGPLELPLGRAVLNGETVTEARWRVRRPDGSEALAIGSARPVHAPDGTHLGSVLTVRDDTERHRTERALAESERRLNAVLNNTRMAIFVMDHRQHCAFMNAAAEKLTGYSLEETQGRPLHDVIHHTYPDGRHFPIEECAIDRAFPEDMQVSGEEVFIHRDGTFYPVSFTASPIYDDATRTVGTVIEVRDVREEREAKERLEIVIAELNHRVKNSLATAQAIVWQGLKDASVPPEVRQGIESRLGALARSHDILTQEAWTGADLRDVVEGALAPFVRELDGRRASVSGEDLRLQPRAALMLGMAFHELATNAVKYGALKEDGGSVEVGWSRTSGVLAVTWIERGGPPVYPRTRRGFGSQVLERAVAHELDAVAELCFGATGVTWTCRIPHTWAVLSG